MTLGLRCSTALLVVVVALAVAAPERAFAQAAGASAEDPTVLFRRGAVAYGGEQYAEAAALFSRAYELSRDASMLYNLGMARQRAGEIDGAIEAYRAFLSERPDASERAEVEASLAALEASQREAAETPNEERVIDPDPPSAPIVPLPTAPAQGPDLLGSALLGGLGVAGLGIALGLSIQAGAVHDAAVAEPVQLRAMALDREANDLALGANVGWIAAGVVTGVAVVWAIVELSDL